MKPKYYLGQKVIVHVLGTNWDNDYNATGEIISLQHSLVGHTYKLTVKLENGEVLCELPEGRINAQL